MTEKKTIYIADDEQNIREGIKAFLDSEGFETTTFASGDLLLEAFRQAPCDLIILDVMMPGTDGFSVCTEIRKMSMVPIIMLTARDSDLDYATGLSLGSDDYFTKPFSAISLVMRVKAIFRRIEYEKHQARTLMEEELPVLTQPSDRSFRQAREFLSFGDLTLDPDGKRAYSGERELSLTPNEFNLLKYLLENKTRAISRDEILERVWGYDTCVETRAADDTVRRLRKKLGGSSVSIEAVWGFGFRLKM